MWLCCVMSLVLAWEEQGATVGAHGSCGWRGCGAIPSHRHSPRGWHLLAPAARNHSWLPAALFSPALISQKLDNVREKPTSLKETPCAQHAAPLGSCRPPEPCPGHLGDKEGLANHGVWDRSHSKEEQRQLLEVVVLSKTSTRAGARAAPPEQRLWLAQSGAVPQPLSPKGVVKAEQTQSCF